MTPLDLASSIVLIGSGAGLAGAAVFALARRGRIGGLTSHTALARAGSYALLGLLLTAAARAGVPGMVILTGVISAAGLYEWGRMFGLPLHHRVAIIAAGLLIIVGIGREGVHATDWLVAGLVLGGSLWPIVRSDTGRAIRDLGTAAIGVALIPVLLAHGVALVVERGGAGGALFLALAASCAFSDVAAFMVGKKCGRHQLAPTLSPNKTREGMAGNFVGAALGLTIFSPALLGAYGAPFLVAMVPLVALGSVWGDLLESAAKREAGVKDAGRWLPGFGGILDRIDSLLITVALAYWIARLFAVPV
jgi:phosphatidate cytidylyltransferase